ncbi:hypothetical protein D3C72_1423440 [compost metagenome]
MRQHRETSRFLPLESRCHEISTFSRHQVPKPSLDGLTFGTALGKKQDPHQKEPCARSESKANALLCALVHRCKDRPASSTFVSRNQTEHCRYVDRCILRNTKKSPQHLASCRFRDGRFHLRQNLVCQCTEPSLCCAQAELRLCRRVRSQQLRARELATRFRADPSCRLSGSEQSGTARPNSVDG